MAFSIGSAVISGLLALGMLITGTTNTISVKFQDFQTVKGFGDGPPRPFEHPFFQTGVMFLGEFFCIFAYYVSGLISRVRASGRSSATASNYSEVPNETPRDDLVVNNNNNNNNNSASSSESEDDEPKKQPYMNPLLLWIPAICDLGSTTLLNIGLLYTYASVYQMLRGSLVVFNALLSWIFLKQFLFIHHFGGLFLIVLGTTVVGLSSILGVQDDGVNAARNPGLGAVLVILSQIVAAVQCVSEEIICSKYDADPLAVVGWEGFFGLSMTTITLGVLYSIQGPDSGSIESAPQAFAQIVNSTPLKLAILGSVLSIAFFNTFGIWITKRISSLTRTTIDSMRTIFIWIASMILRWESFKWIQVVGFLILILGNIIYNEVVKIPGYHPWYEKIKEQREQKKKAKAALAKEKANTSSLAKKKETKSYQQTMYNEEGYVAATVKEE